MKGKEKCKALKEIRKQIAESNDIEYIVSECSHKGECKGTCPKCEAEVRYLERELERRRNLGKTVVVAGIGAGIVATMSGCNTNVMNASVFDPVKNVIHTIFPNTQPEELAGAVEEPPLMGEPEAIPVEGEETTYPPEIDSGIVEDGSEIEVELMGEVEYIPEENEEENDSETGNEEENYSETGSDEAEDGKCDSENKKQ